ncbi:hypothetical protein TAGGR_1719 [Thermodesulfovibrio aggregans]|uniref:O-antigen ligase domain-containing protein n=1 Tax=Thermodesulfovibrio aggregans TaxID=86166 RepID=A0A0U9HN92_9BACT|nr:O-antigen ligase family protein [Thermodesulfovibrio aggregans]GAQ94535.1 hypothetical protein TAGGR_1719 [Thermodesulfovibrio aggregans]
MKTEILLSIVLGIAIGTASLTNLRIYDVIGLSEFLLLLIVIYLILNYGKTLFSFKINSIKGLIKVILFLNIFFISPFITFLNFFALHMQKSEPKYLISFMMGWIIMFGIYNLLVKNKVNMEKIVMISSIIFILLNFIAFIFFYDISLYGGESIYVEQRLKGFSKNPNQMAFYSSVMIIFIFMFVNSLTIVHKIFLILPIIYIGFLSGSDAFVISLIISSLFFGLLYLIKKFKFGLLLVISLTFLIFSFSFYIICCQLEIFKLILYKIDKDGLRVALLVNGIKSILYYPFTGLGPGSYSGISSPFEGMEIHNSFLDFASQYGIVSLLSIITVFFLSLKKEIEKNNYLNASMIIFFLTMNLFHNFSRHFVFWLFIGIFYFRAFYEKETANYLKKDNINV